MDNTNTKQTNMNKLKKKNKNRSYLDSKRRSNQSFQNLTESFNRCFSFYSQYSDCEGYFYLLNYWANIQVKQKQANKHEINKH